MFPHDDSDQTLFTDQQLYLVAAGLASILLFRFRHRLPEAREASRIVGPSKCTDEHGREAEAPSQIPAQGWKDILFRTFSSISEQRLMALAAGSTFYVLLAIFPAIAALVAIYGLFSDPGMIGKQLTLMQGLLPAGATDVLGQELKRLSSQSNGTLSFALVAGLAIALWSANSGVKALFDSLNQVYGEKETRSFFKLNLITLIFTIISILLLAVALAAVVVLPAIVDRLGISDFTATISQVARWPFLFIVLAIVLAFVYRFGPNRREPKWRWVTWGSAAAALLWIIASLLFSWYAANFGSFNKTYGSLGAIVGFMIWIWISMIVVLLGAELDAEMEHQTARDTTVGAARPQGQRGVYVADTVGATQS